MYHLNSKIYVTQACFFTEGIDMILFEGAGKS